MRKTISVLLTISMILAFFSLPAAAVRICNSTLNFDGTIINTNVADNMTGLTPVDITVNWGAGTAVPLPDGVLLQSSNDWDLTDVTINLKNTATNAEMFVGATYFGVRLTATNSMQLAVQPGKNVTCVGTDKVYLVSTTGDVIVPELYYNFYSRNAFFVPANFDGYLMIPFSRLSSGLDTPGDWVPDDYIHTLSLFSQSTSGGAASYTVTDLMVMYGTLPDITNAPLFSIDFNGASVIGEMIEDFNLKSGVFDSWNMQEGTPYACNYFYDENISIEKDGGTIDKFMINSTSRLVNRKDAFLNTEGFGFAVTNDSAGPTYLSFENYSYNEGDNNETYLQGSGSTIILIDEFGVGSAANIVYDSGWGRYKIEIPAHFNGRIIIPYDRLGFNSATDPAKKAWRSNVNYFQSFGLFLHPYSAFSLYIDDLFVVQDMPTFDATDYNVNILGNNTVTGLLDDFSSYAPVFTDNQGSLSWNSLQSSYSFDGKFNINYGAASEDYLFFFSKNINDRRTAFNTADYFGFEVKNNSADAFSVGTEIRGYNSGLPNTDYYMVDKNATNGDILLVDKDGKVTLPAFSMYNGRGLFDIPAGFDGYAIVPFNRIAAIWAPAENQQWVKTVNYMTDFGLYTKSAGAVSVSFDNFFLMDTLPDLTSMSLYNQLQTMIQNMPVYSDEIFEEYDAAFNEIITVLLTADEDELLALSESIMDQIDALYNNLYPEYVQRATDGMTAIVNFGEINEENYEDFDALLMETIGYLVYVEEADVDPVLVDSFMAKLDEYDAFMIEYMNQQAEAAMQAVVDMGVPTEENIVELTDLITVAEDALSYVYESDLDQELLEDYYAIVDLVENFPHQQLIDAAEEAMQAVLDQGALTEENLDLVKALIETAKTAMEKVPTIELDQELLNDYNALKASIPDFEDQLLQVQEVENLMQAVLDLGEPTADNIDEINAAIDLVKAALNEIDSNLISADILNNYNAAADAAEAFVTDEPTEEPTEEPVDTADVSSFAYGFTAMAAIIGSGVLTVTRKKRK